MLLSRSAACDMTATLAVKSWARLISHLTCGFTSGIDVYITYILDS